jgi:2Fe-2S ferredoxin
MGHLRVVSRSGVKTEVDAADGLTIMEIVRDAGFADLMALCGGCCSCATCHVFVDPLFAGRLRELGDDEDELLEGSRHRRPNSRLSCQLVFDETLDGMQIEIAPED